MIKVTLGRIMADKHLKISHVHRDTGIARSTLTKLWYNKAEQIDLNTLDRLCKYLHCNPGDLLEYVPDEKVGDAEQPQGK
ncbi:helix-turn-helix domain-containing protein [Desulfofundulus thermobenzoicus]|uniref:Helix-turn-helix domain-containing protein n=1 Tax=Desulfofundulus thermobenzoicus TaxID=29376 RepID=A0A6N7IWK9_9FIRM|nr:helix-turn-helix transcriptional regulator [Desulfofundulus thermobenzoicus]MQL54003.1 helix-turn-helix domain-containing protein [Desulfofundulus thermobenzoicus]